MPNTFGCYAQNHLIKTLRQIRSSTHIQLKSFQLKNMKKFVKRPLVIDHLVIYTWPSPIRSPILS